MGVFKNRGGPPKWMVYNGKPYQNWWFGYIPLFLETPKWFKNMSFVLISKEEVDAGIDFRRSSMPPTWTQVSTVWSPPSCNPLVGSFLAMGTASSSGNPNVPESTFSKIWVSFLLDSWVGRDLQELKLVKVGLDMPPSNQSRYLSYAELPSTQLLHSQFWLHDATRQDVKIAILKNDIFPWQLQQTCAKPTISQCRTA